MYSWLRSLTGVSERRNLDEKDGWKGRCVSPSDAASPCGNRVLPDGEEAVEKVIQLLSFHSCVSLSSIMRLSTGRGVDIQKSCRRA